MAQLVSGLSKPQAGAEKLLVRGRSTLPRFGCWAMPHFDRGFVLIEAILAVLLTSIMAGVLVSISWVRGDGHRLSASAQTVAQDIRLVQQMNANQDGTGYSIIFDCSRERYLIVKGLGVSILKAVDLPGGIDLVYTGFEKNRLEFYTDGRPRPYGGHLVLCDQSGRSLYVIVQTMTGRVRVDAQPP